MVILGYFSLKVPGIHGAQASIIQAAESDDDDEEEEGAGFHGDAEAAMKKR